ncbi:MAG: vitamin K epoxide reductase [Deltaproteobacteria bacterium]|nr:vitamin K epoxide reductase [Deltaproteobacteria bacterium]
MNHWGRALWIDSFEDVPELSVIPEPWEYNPSSWAQRIRVALIATSAVFIAGYLGLYQIGLTNTVWDPIFGRQSELVIGSDISHTMTGWFRIPDAVLGALAYLGDVIFALAGSTRRWQYRPWLVILFGLDVIPLGIVSAVLVFLQGAALGAWCTLCLVTAIISLTLVVLAYDEVWTCFLYLRKVYQKSGSLQLLWKAFLGYPSQEAHEAGEALIQQRTCHREQRGENF